MRLILAALARSAAIVPVQARIVGSKIVGWADVNTTGSLYSYKNVVSASRLDLGKYQIVFKAKVHDCAPTVTRFFYPVSAIAQLVGDKEIEVDTFQASTGNYVDSGFSVVVTC
jgi:hypothetical protein